MVDIYETRFEYREKLAEYVGVGRHFNALSDWQDLMMVVSKIESEVYDFVISKGMCKITENMVKDENGKPLSMNTYSCSLGETPYESKMEMIYTACLKYIYFKKSYSN